MLAILLASRNRHEADAVRCCAGHGVSRSAFSILR